MNPVFEKLSSESPSVRFYKVDIDACQDIANEVGIRSVSTPPAESVAVAPTLGLDPRILCLQRRGEIRRTSGWRRSRTIDGTFPLPDVIADR